MGVTQTHLHGIPIVTLDPIDRSQFLSRFPCQESDCDGIFSLEKDEVLFRNGSQPWNKDVPELAFRTDCWGCDKCKVRCLPVEVCDNIKEAKLESLA